MATELGWTKRILFTGVLALFVLSTIELMLQAYYFGSTGSFLFRRTFLPIFESDPVRCYRLKPDLDYRHTTNEFSVSVFTNARGFRTDATREVVPYEKQPGVYRILFLGPSFAFGWGSEFEESYAALLARWLEERGHRVELINLGTPAQGPGPQLCWLREEGYKYHPDMIVQTGYAAVGSLAVSCPEELTCPVIEGGYLFTQKPTFRLRAVAWLKQSAIVFYGYYLYQELTHSPSDALTGTGKEFHGEEARSIDEADRSAVVAKYERYLAYVRGLLGDQTQVVFLHLPLSYVVHPADVGRWSHLGVTDPLEKRRVSRAALSALREHGLHVVDPIDPLVERGKSERMYYWLDVHLTPAGNRVVARAALPVVEGLIAGNEPAANRRSAALRP